MSHMIPPHAVVQESVPEIKDDTRTRSRIQGGGDT
jgi:hypothetical protein